MAPIWRFPRASGTPSGYRFTVSFDGKTLFMAEDDTLAGLGKVALWTKADSVTHFDTIVITPLG